MPSQSRTLTASHARLQAHRIPSLPDATCSTSSPAVATRPRRERGEAVEIGTFPNVIVFADVYASSGGSWEMRSNRLEPCAFLGTRRGTRSSLRHSSAPPEAGRPANCTRNGWMGELVLGTRL